MSYLRQVIGLKVNGRSDGSEDLFDRVHEFGADAVPRDHGDRDPPALVGREGVEAVGLAELA